AGTLTLSEGVLEQPIGFFVQVNNPATGAIVGGSATAYVDGALTRATNATADYAFPIGDGGRYRNVVVAPNAVTATSYTAEFFASDPTAADFRVGDEFMYLDQTSNDPNNSGGNQLANVSSQEYYDISGTEPASIELHWAAETFASGSDLGASFTNARVAHWVTTAPVGGATPITNGAWVNEGGVSHGGDETAGRVRSGIVTTFSPFAIGSNDPINSLPIELLSFSGERVENGVALAWNTASELNNDRFEVQRALSPSFEGYQTIGTVAGSGTTTTETRYTYTDGEAPITRVYYRLRQVDYDGTATLSRTIEVGGELSWYLDPNPSTSSQLEFGATGADIPANAKVGVQVVGTNGQVLLSQTGAYTEVRALVLSRLTKAAPGQYIVRLTYLGRTFTLRHLRY
ncbi:MAG: T9SS type A sorting domain-containing protein, partial [Bacteroidia bacterium]|nr:T9SS type A sorting domain-containing protein [Bacteroidia bacterium]